MALKAIETGRAVPHPVRTALHGNGLATCEAVIHAKGFDHLKRTLSTSSGNIPPRKNRGLRFDLPDVRQARVVPLRRG